MTQKQNKQKKKEKQTVRQQKEYFKILLKSVMI
jgi:hypothetical protein